MITVGFYIEANKRLKRRLKDRYELVAPAIALDEGAGTQYGQWLNQWIAATKPSDDLIRVAVAKIVQLHPQAKFINKQPKLLEYVPLDGMQDARKAVDALAEFAESIRGLYRTKKDRSAGEDAVDLEVVAPNVVKTNNFAAAFYLHGGGAKYNDQMPWCGGRSKDLYNNYGGDGKNRYIVFPKGADKTVTINGQQVPWSKYAFTVSVRNNGTLHNINDPDNQYPSSDSFDRDGANAALRILNQMGLCSVSEISEWSDVGLVQEDWPGFGIDEALAWHGQTFATAAEVKPWTDHSIGIPTAAWQFKMMGLTPDQAATILTHTADSIDGLEYYNFHKLKDTLNSLSGDEEQLVKFTESGLYNFGDKHSLPDNFVVSGWQQGDDIDWAAISDDATRLAKLSALFYQRDDLSDEALATIAQQFGVTDTQKVIKAGLPINEIERWVQSGSPSGALSGMTIEQFDTLAAEVGEERAKLFGHKWLPRFSFEEARKWSKYSEFGPAYADMWRKAGFTPEEAKYWSDRGWNLPEDAKRQQALGLSAEDSRGWDSEIDDFIKSNQLSDDYDAAAAAYKKLEELGGSDHAMYPISGLPEPRRLSCFAAYVYRELFSNWKQVIDIIEAYGWAPIEMLAHRRWRNGNVDVSAYMNEFGTLFQLNQDGPLLDQVIEAKATLQQKQEFLRLLTPAAKWEGSEQQVGNFKQDPQVTLDNLTAAQKPVEPVSTPSESDMTIDKEGNLEISAPRTIVVGFYVEANKRLKRRLKDNYALVADAVALDEGAGTQYGQWLNQWIAATKPSDERIKQAADLIKRLHPQAKFLNEQPKLLDSLGPKEGDSADDAYTKLEKYANDTLRKYRAKKNRSAEEEDADIEVISPNIVKTNNFAAAYYLHGGGAKYKNQMPWCGGRSKSLYDNYGGEGLDRYIVFPDGPTTTYEINGQSVPWSNYAFVISMRGDLINNINDPENQYPDNIDFDSDGAEKATDILASALGIEIEQASEWEEYGLNEDDWSGWEIEDAVVWSQHGFEDADEATTWIEAGFKDPEEAERWRSEESDPELAGAFLDAGLEPDNISDLRDLDTPEAVNAFAASGLLDIEDSASGLTLSVLSDGFTKLRNLNWSALDEDEKAMYVAASWWDRLEDFSSSDLIELAAELPREKMFSVMRLGLLRDEIEKWGNAGEIENAASGLTVEEWKELEQEGMSRSEIMLLGQELRAPQGGVTPSWSIAEGRKWQEKFKRDLMTANRWYRSGFTPDEASDWISGGFLYPEAAKKQQALGLTALEPQGWDPKVEQFKARQHFQMSDEEALAVYNELKKLGAINMRDQIQYVADEAKSWEPILDLVRNYGGETVEAMSSLFLRKMINTANFHDWVRGFKEIYNGDVSTARNAASLALLHISPEHKKKIIELMHGDLDRYQLDGIADNAEGFIWRKTLANEGIYSDNWDDDLSLEDVIAWANAFTLSAANRTQNLGREVSGIRQNGWTIEHVKLFPGTSASDIEDWSLRLPGIKPEVLNGWLNLQEHGYFLTADDIAAAIKSGSTPETYLAQKQGPAKQEATPAPAETSVTIDKEGNLEVAAPKTIVVGFYVEANKKLRRRLKDKYELVIPAVSVDEGAGTQYGQWLNQWIAATKPSDEQIKKAVELIAQLHPQAKYLNVQPKLLDNLPTTNDAGAGLEELKKYANEVQLDYRRKKDRAADEEDADIDVLSPNIVKTNNFAGAYYLHGGGRKFNEQMPWCGGRSQSLYNNYGGPGLNRYIVFPNGADKTVEVNGREIPWSNYAFVVSVLGDSTLNNINDPSNNYPSSSEYDSAGAEKALQILNEDLGLDIQAATGWDEAGLNAIDWEDFDLDEAMLWSNHSFNSAEEATPWRVAGIDPETAQEFEHERIPPAAARLFIDDSIDATDASDIWDEIPGSGKEQFVNLEEFLSSKVKTIAEDEGVEWKIAVTFYFEHQDDDLTHVSDLELFARLLRDVVGGDANNITYNEISYFIEDFDPDMDMMTKFIESSMGLEEAHKWLEAGNPEGIKTGLKLEEWKQLQAAGLDEAQINKFGRQFVKSELNLDEALAWFSAGFFLSGFGDRAASAWRSHGFRPDEAKAWLEAKFSPEDAKKQQSFGLGPEDERGWSPELEAFMSKQLFAIDPAKAHQVVNKLKELKVSSTQETYLNKLADASLAGWDRVFDIVDEFGLDAAVALGVKTTRYTDLQAVDMLNRTLPRLRAFYTPKAHIQQVVDLAASTVEITPEMAKRVLESLDPSRESVVTHDLLGEIERDPEAFIETQTRQRQVQQYRRKFLEMGIEPAAIAQSPDDVSPDEFKRWSQYVYRNADHQYPNFEMLQVISDVKREQALDLLPVLAKYAAPAAMTPRDITNYVQKVKAWAPDVLDAWLQAAKTKNPSTSIYQAIDASWGARRRNLTPEQWISEQQEKTASKDTYSPTESMRNNAKRGLEYRKRPGGKGGTEVGVNTARLLSSGKNLSRDMVAKMHSFFSRHDGNQKVKDGKEPHEDAGYVAWLLWGGDSGKTWAANIMNKEKKAQQAPEFQRDLVDVLEEVRRLIDERGPHPSLIAVMRGLKRKIEQEKSFGLREAVRIPCVDSMQRRTELDLSEVKPGDRVKFTSDFRKTGTHIEAGEEGVVRRVGAESLEVEAIGSIQRQGGIEVKQCVVDVPADNLILLLHNEDPRA